MDSGDGDFYIWLDLLLGLLVNHNSGLIFSRVVLVTNDVKIDWSRNGVAHPILGAEIHALFGAEFEIWTLDRLTKEIASALQEEAAVGDQQLDEVQEVGIISDLGVAIIAEATTPKPNDQVSEAIEGYAEPLFPQPNDGQASLAPELKEGS